MQAGIILRTLLGCGAAGSADKLGVLEQIQGSLLWSEGPPGVGESFTCEWDILCDTVAENGPLANLRRLDRTRLGGGNFVESFAELPDAERKTSAEIDKAFEKDVQGKVKVKKALFEHAQDATEGAFVSTALVAGTRSTSKDTTSSSSSISAECATRAAKRQAVEQVRFFQENAGH